MLYFDNQDSGLGIMLRVYDAMMLLMESTMDLTFTWDIPPKLNLNYTYENIYLGLAMMEGGWVSGL